jgi:L-ascorbate metabolism protein UlaG (beta-lactamase superfamily)
MSNLECSNLQMRCRKPVIQDDAFIANVQSWNSREDQFRLWWLGQSGYLLGWNGAFGLIDPYLSDSLTIKYASTLTPHVRMVERVVDPARLDFITFTTSSHEHTDHQDPETLRPLIEANPSMRLIVPAATASLCSRRLGVKVDQLVLADEGRTVRVGEFAVTGIPSAHESREYDDQGHCRFLGYIFRFGHWTIYHSGDTVMHKTLVKTVREFRVDLAILPINGRSAIRGVAGNLNPNEAVHLARDIEARVAVPCHYDMFEFNTGDPEEFRILSEACGQPYRILPVGGYLDSTEIVGAASHSDDERSERDPFRDTGTPENK